MHVHAHTRHTYLHVYTPHTYMCGTHTLQTHLPTRVHTPHIHMWHTHTTDIPTHTCTHTTHTTCLQTTCIMYTHALGCSLTRGVLGQVLCRVHLSLPSRKPKQVIVWVILTYKWKRGSGRSPGGSISWGSVAESAGARFLTCECLPLLGILVT